MAQRTGRPPREDKEIDELVWPVIEKLRDPETGKLPPQRAVAADVRRQGEPISAAHVQSSMARWTQHQPPRVAPPTEPLPPAFVQTMAGLLESDRREQRRELEARNAELTASNEDLTREDLQHQAQLAALQAQLEERDREQATLSGQLTEVTAARDKLTEELKVERETAKQLRNELATANLRAQQLEPLRADHDRLQADFHLQREALIKAETANHALNQRIADLERRETTAVDEVQALRKRLGELTDHLQRVESQRAEAVGKAGAAEGALSQLTTELAHQREDLLREKADKAEAVRGAGAAEGSLAAARAEIQQLQTDLTECRGDREHLIRENSTLTEQLRAHATKVISNESKAPGK